MMVFGVNSVSSTSPSKNCAAATKGVEKNRSAATEIPLRFYSFHLRFLSAHAHTQVSRHGVARDRSRVAANQCRAGAGKSRLYLTTARRENGVDHPQLHACEKVRE
jgi:hypothetical protein